MAGTINQAVALVQGTDLQSGLSESFLVKKGILDYFFRCESLVGNNGKLVELGYFLVEKIAKETQTTDDLVFKVMGQFLKRVTYFKQFLESGLITWAHGKQGLYRKVRVYLHKT